MTTISKLGTLTAALAAMGCLALAAPGPALAAPSAAQQAAHPTGLGPPPPPPPPFYLASGQGAGPLDPNTSFCYQPSPAPTSITNDPVNPACTPLPVNPVPNPYIVSPRYPGWGAPLTAASPPTASQWVGPQANGQDTQEAVPDWYIYDAEFSGCAKISGKVMADNEVGVFLDGTWLNDSSATSPYSFKRPPLTFTGAATSAGNHVIDFVVDDLSGSATGIDYLVKVIPTNCKWTVHGGNFKSPPTKAVLTDTSSGFAVTCKSSTIAGHLVPGTHLNPLGTISPLAFSGCTSALGAFTLTAASGGLQVNGTGYNASTQVTTGTISGLHLTLAGNSSCSAVVDGTGAAANDGQADFTYSNTSHQLTVLTTGGNLHFYTVSGCAGLVIAGDPATLSASYTVSPPQNIVSP